MNRHNAGFMVADLLAKRHGLGWRKHRCHALAAKGEVAGEKVLLAKPLTFMNQSGQAVSCLLRYFGLAVEDLIAVHDDLDLPLGTVRVKKGGGSGGHKGIESVATSLGDPQFVRVRLGIGRPPQGTDPADYVLSDFAADELKEAKRATEVAAQAIESLVTSGLTRTLNVFNAPRRL